MLTRERILGLFSELDEELGRAAIRGDVFIVGGAAMTLAYDAIWARPPQPPAT